MHSLAYLSSVSVLIPSNSTKYEKITSLALHVEGVFMVTRATVHVEGVFMVTRATVHVEGVFMVTRATVLCSAGKFLYQCV